MPIVVIAIAAGSLFAGSYDPHFGILLPPGAPAILQGFRGGTTKGRARRRFLALSSR